MFESNPVMQVIADMVAATQVLHSHSIKYGEHRQFDDQEEVVSATWQDTHLHIL